jgi:hypothetical protein
MTVIPDPRSVTGAEDEAEADEIAVLRRLAACCGGGPTG